MRSNILKWRTKSIRIRFIIIISFAINAMCQRMRWHEPTAKMFILLGTDEFTSKMFLQENSTTEIIFKFKLWTHENRMNKKPFTQKNQHTLEFNTLLTTNWMHFGEHYKNFVNSLGPQSGAGFIRCHCFSMHTKWLKWLLCCLQSWCFLMEKGLVALCVQWQNIFLRVPFDLRNGENKEAIPRQIPEVRKRWNDFC